MNSEPLDPLLLQSLSDLNNLISVIVLATVALPLIVHISVALYRVIKCESWARRFGIWSLSLSLIGLMFLTLPELNSSTGRFLILAAILSQIVSGFVKGTKSKIPDIIYISFIISGLVVYFIIIPSLG